MRVLLKILNWLFVLYAVLPAVVIIGVSIRSGIGQGLQFIFLPIIVLYFFILFWWTKNVLRYMSVSAGTIGSKETYFIFLQVLCLSLLVVVPLILLTIHLIWNRIAGPTPLENISALCFMLLISSGIFLSLIGIVLGVRYLNKVNQINGIDNT